MKNHLKRIAAPRTWHINRKKNVFIVRPNPGGHALASGMALGYVLRDILSLADTMGEVKKLLNNNQVLVDGKRRTDHRFMVGLFDIIAIPNLNRYYRLGLDGQGRITMNNISKEETGQKICKVVGKKLLSGKLLQLHLHDGKNIISDRSIKVGDSVKLEVPSLKLQGVVSLKEGSTIYLIGGKNSGNRGALERIEGYKAYCRLDKEKIETDKKYLFAVE